jgi:pilus assembly protein Flp/PilA
MARLYARLYGFIHDEKGATAIEYGLIATLVSVVIIAGLTALGGDLNTAFNNIANAIKGAP